MNDRLTQDQKQKLKLIEQIAIAVRKRIVGKYGTSYNKCSDAANELDTKLTKAGIRHKWHDGYFKGEIDDFSITSNEHAWIEILPEGWIVDITADQFGGYPEVWVRAPKSLYTLRYYDKNIPIPEEDAEEDNE